jgi:hypothetical protein
LKILINPKTFLREFVEPVLDVAKGDKSAIFIDGEWIYTLWANAGVRMGLYQAFKPKAILDFIPRFNVDLAKIAQALKCLPKECEETVLNIDPVKKKVIIKDDKFNITIGMVEDKLVNVPAIANVRSLDPSIIYDEIPLNMDAIKDLKKAGAFASDSLKMYLENVEGNLVCTLGDKTESHLDRISLVLKENMAKSLAEHIYDAAFLNNIFRVRSDITLKILTNKALLVTASSENSKTIHLATHIKK